MRPSVFLCHNPGGFKAILPVANSAPHSVVILTEALAKFAGEIKSQNLIIAEKTSREALKEILLRLNPGVLITGTSVTQGVGGQLENWARQIAKASGIPSLTVLDHWCNYAARFTYKKPLDSLPDHIAVMDERARNEMVAAGFPKQILVITGQPAFDEIIRTGKTQRPQLREAGRLRLQIPDDIHVVGFISEPLSQDFAGVRPYDEQTVAEQLIEYFGDTDSFLFFKTHPRDLSGKFEELAIQAPQLNAREIGDFPPREFVAACDIVIGMTSILLLESYWMGLPVISFQPESYKEDPWVQSIEPVPVCNSFSHLSKFMNHAKMRSTTNVATMPYPAADRVAALIEQVKQVSGEVVLAV